MSFHPRRLGAAPTTCIEDKHLTPAASASSQLVSALLGDAELIVTVQVGVIVAIAVAFVAIVLLRQARAWRKYHGRFVVVCPENRAEVGVAVDARHAARTALTGSPELRLTSCSRWPERAGCGQTCLGQLAATAEDCLVRNVLERWYEGKTCAYCGRPFGGIDWNLAKPALLRDGVAVEWPEIPAENLHGTLAAAKPVCSACYLANKMVQEHPELVADRSGNSRMEPKP